MTSLSPRFFGQPRLTKPTFKGIAFRITGKPGSDRGPQGTVVKSTPGAGICNRWQIQAGPQRAIMPAMLRKHWKLTAIAVFSLSIAMALGVIALSVSNTVLLLPPAAAEPGRLV